MIFFRFACITSAISHEFFSITHLDGRSPVLINQNQSLAFLLTGSFYISRCVEICYSKACSMPRRLSSCRQALILSGVNADVPWLSEIKYSEARNETARASEERRGKEANSSSSNSLIASWNFFDNVDDDDDDDDDDLSSNNGRSLMSMPFLSFDFVFFSEGELCFCSMSLSRSVDFEKRKKTRRKRSDVVIRISKDEISHKNIERKPSITLRQKRRRRRRRRKTHLFLSRRRRRRRRNLFYYQWGMWSGWATSNIQRLPRRCVGSLAVLSLWVLVQFSEIIDLSMKMKSERQDNVDGIDQCSMKFE